METISVIIPCYNCEREIEACIRAILRSTCPPLEIIAVDDCSKDGTREKIKSLSRGLSGKIKLTATTKNSGPARARNTGAKVAEGEYLFFLDSDTQVLPDALANFAKRIEQCDAVVGIYDEKPSNSGASPRYKAMLYAYLLGQRGVQTYDQFSASCAGIRSVLYRDLGGYDEWFPPGLDFENEEFGHRISSHYRMVLDPAVRARHRFPGFRKMTRTFFQRTALGVEMFMLRRKFSTLAGTPKTGISSMALLGSAVLLPLTALHPLGFIPSLVTYLIYLYGYTGFFGYVAKKRPAYLPTAILLNHYYTLVIACGALYGLFRVVTGGSQIIRKFTLSRNG